MGFLVSEMLSEKRVFIDVVPRDPLVFGDFETLVDEILGILGNIEFSRI
jgi:hypothetical protein